MNKSNVGVRTFVTYQRSCVLFASWRWEPSASQKIYLTKDRRRTMGSGRDGVAAGGTRVMWLKYIRTFCHRNAREN